MAKICPICRRPQTDDRQIMCLECKEVYVDKAKAPLNLLRDDLEQIVSKILKSPRVWFFVFLGMIGAAVSVLSAIDLFTGRNLRTLTMELERSSSNKLDEAYGTITNQIVLQLREPRISETVSNIAAGEAQWILRREVSPVVENF